MKNALSNDRALFVMLQDDLLLFLLCEPFGLVAASGLKQGIEEYRKMGYYTIKHTDGNIMPILKQIADCKPDAIHSLDPQGGVSIPEVRKIVGDDICLIGNVNCGLLQTGTDEEMEADVLRSLREGMATGRGYVFSTSNCAYTGLALERYEKMIELWRKHGNYDLR
jgi:uroporphyrinogen decarboxylase